MSRISEQEPVDFARVIRAEREALGLTDELPRGVSALCLSGGGIRSATFSLGVIQGLARLGLLQQFDYLSTVSGGGYIGGWFSTWIRRAGIDRVVQCLSSPSSVAPFEPEPVRHLRNHSTYLTEKSGPMFGGAWTWVSTYLWQLLVYWLMLGLSAAAVLLLPRLWFSFLTLPQEWGENICAVVCVVCAVTAVGYVASDLPSLRGRGWPQGWFVLFFLVPIFLCAYGLTTWIVCRGPLLSWRVLVQVSLWATVACGVGTIPLWQQGRFYWKWRLLTAPLGGIAGGVAAYWLNSYFVTGRASDGIVFAPSIVAVLLFLVAIVFPSVVTSGRSDDLEWMNVAGSAVFLVALLLALVTHLNTLGSLRRPGDFLDELEHWGVLVGLTLVLGRVINVNQLSQQSSYRNRLVRAYLGASNPNRRPHPLTGMDARDNVPLAELAGQRPLHVINMALNLSSRTTGMRRSESFTMTPLYCGSTRLGFRPTKEYGGGVSLGTAVGISGAAVEPGYVGGRSRWRRALLLAFNARLGMWLGNPGCVGHRTWRSARPTFAISSLLEEMMGLATEKGAYVRLSDGGHFENLGLYEMVQRRCRYIVAVDAGEDPMLTCEDLYNAVNKIRADFGVPIEIEHKTGEHAALGRVHYSAVDPGAQDGVLLYIKAALTGDEPGEIVHYAKAHGAFPHESTTNQWFDEAQWESYRALGEHSVLSVIAPDWHWGFGTMEEYFAGLIRSRGRATAAGAE